MSSIDSRIVEAKFDNSQFESGIRSTLNSLDKLKNGLKLEGATSGLHQIDDAAKNNNIGRMGDAADNVASRFSAMRVVAYTAIATITHQAVVMAEKFVKSFTISPIMAGFQNYETQINAVQTILANTGLKGASGLNQVNAALGQLNTYANQTVYNFSEMAKNIGTFTAAGVDLKTSTASIKGIANLAALSGSNSDQASTAMYQLSQAIAANSVKLQDWNSVVNAGLGGKVFQTALFNTGQALHTIKNAKVGESFDQWTKAGNTFRGSLHDGWLTGKVLTQTLQGFTGDLTAAQLKSMGYNAAQIKQIQEMGKTALGSATKIKTLTQLGQALKEEVATAYGAVFKTIFGDINEATTLFSKVHTVVENALTGPINAFNKVLQGWAKLGGRMALLDAISLGLKEIGRVIKPVKDAFREIFPRKTAQDLFNMTASFHVFIENLNVSDTTVKNIKRTFAGFFAVIDIGWQILKGGVKFIASLLGEFRKGSGGILNTTGNIGDFLVALDQAIKKGDGVRKFFDGLKKALTPLIHVFVRVKDAILGLFDFKAPSAAGIQKAFHPITSLGQAILDVWMGAIHILGRVMHIFEPLASHMAKFFGSLGSAISSALGGINYEDFLHTINTALFAGLVLLIKKFVGNLGKGIQNPAAGFLEKITSPFEAVTGTMKKMQSTLQATTLLQIAAALGIMTLSVIGLARVDPIALTRSLTALTVMFTQLFASMAIFQRIGGAKGLAGTAFGLTVLAVALRVLVSSVTALSNLSWNELAKGISGVVVLLGVLTLAVKGMSGESSGMIRAGAGLALLAIGVKILVSAVTDLSGLSWGEMAKGLTGVAVTLAALMLFTKFADANKGGILQGAGLILLATAIKILASAVDDFSKTSWGGLVKGLASISAILLAVAIFSKTVGNPLTLMASGVALIMIGQAMNMLASATAKFGALSWGEIAKGLVSMAAALALIAIALNALPPSTLLSAAAILIVASSLGMIASAVSNMGAMSWGEIAKGLVTLAASLAIIVIAMAGMTGALAGAAATIVAAEALKILAQVLITLGSQSWGDIVKGLVALAGVFVVLGVAGLLLAPVTPILLGLGAAIALLGVGIALAGAGVLAFSIGLTAIATSGAAAALAIVAIVTSILGVLPVIAKELVLVIVTIAVGIAHAAPAVFAAMTAVAVGLLRTIITVAPLLIHTIGVLMVSLAAEIARDAPALANSGLLLMIGLLNAMKSKMPALVKSFADMLSSLFNELAKNMPRMVSSGVNLIASFLAGIAKNLSKIIDKGTDIVIAFVKGIAKSGVRLTNAALDAIVTFLNGIADAINSHVDELNKAGLHIAEALINGLTGGLAGKAGKVIKAAIGLGGKAIGGIGHALGIGSPSKEFRKIGEWSGIGLANGLESYASIVANSAYLVGDQALSALQQSLAAMHTAVPNTIDINPTITPVLDLSGVKKDSADIGSLLTPPPITVGTSYSQAKNASVGYEVTKAAVADAAAPIAPGETSSSVSFTQNNYSPKALTSAEIYRQTKNQLSVVKKGVPTDANVS